MAIFNFFLQLNTYSDSKANNAPNLSNFKWVRDISGVSVSNPSSQTFTIPASTSLTVFASAAKKFIYVEASQNANVAVNGNAAMLLKPFVIGSATQPGTLFLKMDVTGLVISNPSTTDELVVFVAAAE